MIINEWNLKIPNEFLTKIKTEYSTKDIAPEYNNLFKVFELIKPLDVNVVILGQDPYPKKGDANGIAFSVSRDTKLPASLKNIFKELENDLNIKRTDGDLSDIVNQGVLLLNTVLTTEVGKPKSHSNMGWEEITLDVIKTLSKKGNIIFVLLGNDAQQYEKEISTSNFIIKTSHPSPLAAYRGFLGSKIFSQINSVLTEQNKKIIQW